MGEVYRYGGTARVEGSKEGGKDGDWEGSACMENQPVLRGSKAGGKHRDSGRKEEGRMYGGKND